MMSATEIGPYPKPPLSMTCEECGDGEMRLVSVEPEIGRDLYVYECLHKHRHEVRFVRLLFGSRREPH
jgi:hypothetical protein